MIYVGIDDTDTLDTPGTNQLARALVARVTPAYQNVQITRHQLLFDPRVPYTSKNSSASILLMPSAQAEMEQLVSALRAAMLDWFKPGSDPGLCVTQEVPDDVVSFGKRCQQEIVTQQEARTLAAEHGLHLEGLGGTEGGVIGALAAVGLIAAGNDGRVVQLGAWPDDLSGPQDASVIRARGIEIHCVESGDLVLDGCVNVGEHLRPNLRGGKIALFVTRCQEKARTAAWQAVRMA